MMGAKVQMPAVYATKLFKCGVNDSFILHEESLIAVLLETVKRYAVKMQKALVQAQHILGKPYCTRRSDVAGYAITPEIHGVCAFPQAFSDMSTLTAEMSTALCPAIATAFECTNVKLTARIFDNPQRNRQAKAYFSCPRLRNKYGRLHRLDYYTPISILQT